MSLLSNRHVQLSLRPDGMQATAWRGRLRPQRTAERGLALDAADRSDDADARAVRQLLDQLAPLAPIAGSTLHVDLADALVHFDVVEGEFAGLGARTLASFADACVNELLGDQAAAYLVRWQLQRDERHLLVCALPRHWVDAVTAAARAHHLGVGTIRPRFNLQWNRHVGGKRAAHMVFVVADGPNALITCVRDGAVTAISNGPWFADRGDFEDSAVDRLLAGMGLADKSNVALIDLQVDRLLASLGIDPAAPRDYVMVSAAEPHVYLSHRWTVLAPSGERP